MMRKKYSLPTMAFIAALALFSGLIIASCLDMTPSSTAQGLQPEPSNQQAQTSEPDNEIGREALTTLPDFARLAKRVRPAVVNISTTKVVRSPFGMRRGGPPVGPPGGRPGRPPGGGDPFEDFFDRFFHGQPREFKQQSLGSGFVIDAEGYILTNNHVIDAADEIIVTFADETELPAKVVGKDPKTDIALIKVDTDRALTEAQLGDSDSLDIGEWILAIGNPFGLSHTVTAGIVSAKGRVIGAGPYDDFIQTDASINPGNSGGPLLNTRGQVVGINTAIFSQTGQSAGIGFAIPINIAKNIANQLKKTGQVTRGWLGVLIQRIDPDLQASYGLKSADGALVAKVVPGGPADEAGIEREDIILEFNGKPVEHHSDLPVMVANVGPGEDAKVKLLRNGKEKTIDVRIGELEEERQARASPPAGQEEDRLGLQLQELTPEMAQQLSVENGVLVAGVEPGSPAEQKGIQGGDVILEVNQKSVEKLDQFIEAIKKIPSGKMVRLLIRREDNQYYVALPKP